MNEMWASEVERKLRAISDKLTSLNQTDLRLQGAQNFGFPIAPNPEFDETEEIAWIRLTDKTVIGGVNTYAWRRQVYVMTGGGMAWVDTGDSGTFSENPAIGLNNENRSTTDGKRYPAKFNPDTSQWIFFLRDEESPAEKFVNRLRLRQIGGFHYPSGSPGDLVEYTSATNPERLRFWNFVLSSSIEVDNFDVSEFTFAWTEIDKAVEAYDGEGNTYAEYVLADSFGEIAYLRIVESFNGLDYIFARKTVRQVENGVVNFVFVSRVLDIVASSEAVLRAGTSGTRVTGYTIGGGQQMTFLANTTTHIGGNSNHEICWGDGCITPVTPTLPTNIFVVESEVSPIAVRQASSIISNFIPPSRLTTTAAVQIGSVDPNTLQTIVEPRTTLAASIVSTVPSPTSLAEVATSATAISYSETSIQPATATISTQGQIYTVPRALPESASTAASGTLGIVAIPSPSLAATASSVSSLCVIVPVALPVPAASTSIVSSSIGANSAFVVTPEAAQVTAYSAVTQVALVQFAAGQAAAATVESQAIAIFVRRPMLPATSTTITTQLGAAIVRQPDPSETMSGATTTLSIVTVRPVSAPITETNPRVTVSTSLTAEAVPENDYEEFCDLLATNGSNWNQLDGLLIVKINGTTVTESDAGDFTGGVTVSFEFASSLQQFLDENTDVTISYEWETVCSGVPKLPETGSGTVSDGGSVSVPFTNNCGGDERNASFNIVMTTPTNRALFNTTCSPWGTNQGISARTVYFTFDMFP